VAEVAVVEIEADFQKGRRAVRKATALILLLSFLLVACDSAIPTADISAIQTQAAQDLIATLTAEAPTTTPTHSPTPTNTPTPTPDTGIADWEYLFCITEPDIAEQRKSMALYMSLTQQANANVDIENLILWLPRWEQETRLLRKIILACPTPSHDCLHNARASELARLDEILTGIDFWKRGWFAPTANHAEATRLIEQGNTNFEKAAELAKNAEDAYRECPFIKGD